MRLQQQPRIIRLLAIGFLSWMAVGQVGSLLQACLSFPGPAAQATPTSACTEHPMPEPEAAPSASCVAWMACCQVRPATPPSSAPELRPFGLSLALVGFGLEWGPLVFFTPPLLQRTAFPSRRSGRARRHLVLSMLLI